MAKGVPGELLFCWLKPLVLKGGVQPHVAGTLARFSVITDVLGGVVHHNLSLYVDHAAGSSEEAGG